MGVTVLKKTLSLLQQRVGVDRFHHSRWYPERSMHRAQLIMNPEARAVTPAMRSVVESALKGRFKLDSVTTRARDDGIAAARDAVEEGAELIVAFGGDGLVNEVVNGMVGSDATLAIVPGGTMNVLARNLGIPRGILEATDWILQRAGQADPLSLRLGEAGGRFFTFAFGAGFDADAARWVEAHTATKRRFGEPYFYAAGFLTFIREYGTKAPFLTIETGSGVHEAVMAIALNGGVYAYLAGRPVRLGSGTPLDEHLELFMLRRMQFYRLPQYALGAFVTGNFGSDGTSVSGLESFVITGKEPFAVHFDGEPMPSVDRLEVRKTEMVLRVLA